VVWNGTIAGLEQESVNTLTYNTSSITPVSTVLSTIAVPSPLYTKAQQSPASSSSVPTTTTSPLPTTLVHSPATTIHPNFHHDSLKYNKTYALKPHIDIADYRPITIDGQTGVILHGHDGKDITLDNKCLVTLNWPLQT
jgi:hypothetical protein